MIIKKNGNVGIGDFRVFLGLLVLIEKVSSIWGEYRLFIVSCLIECVDNYVDKYTPCGVV